MAMTLKQAIQGYRAELVNFQTGHDARPRDSYWKAIENLITAATDSKNKEVQPFQYNSICEMVKRYIEFLEANPDERFMKGGNLWGNVIRSIDAFLEARETYYKRTEPVKELVMLEVHHPGTAPITDEQISKMHGISISTVARMRMLFKDHKEEEAMKLYPKNHETPEEKQRRERLQQEARRYRMAIQNWEDRPNDSFDTEPEEDNWEAPPESIEELMSLPGMTDEQIASMHRIPVEEVQQIRAGNLLPKLEEPSQQSIEQEVYSCVDQDLGPEEIAQMLGIEVSEVKTIISNRSASHDSQRPKAKAKA